jgi:hypothetical protein
MDHIRMIAIKQSPLWCIRQQKAIKTLSPRPWMRQTVLSRMALATGNVSRDAIGSETVPRRPIVYRKYRPAVQTAKGDLDG